jgi:hypothetical protein
MAKNYVSLEGFNVKFNRPIMGFRTAARQGRQAHTLFYITALAERFNILT